MILLCQNTHTHTQPDQYNEKRSPSHFRNLFIWKLELLPTTRFILGLADLFSTAYTLQNGLHLAVPPPKHLGYGFTHSWYTSTFISV